MGDGGGGGLIFRDVTGAFRGAACSFFPSIACAEATELLACRRAVQLAMELNYQKIHVEMDCLNVVNMLNDQSKNLSSAGQVVEELNVSKISLSAEHLQYK